MPTEQFNQCLHKHLHPCSCQLRLKRLSQTIGNVFLGLAVLLTLFYFGTAEYKEWDSTSLIKLKGPVS